MRRARRQEVGLRTAQGRGGGTEFDQLRDYTPDDESRRIDWAATARTGRPIVRTYRAEQNQVVVTLLDNGRVMAGQVAGVPRVEHAMDAAMALTSVAARLGDRAGLVAFDATVRAVVPPASGARQVGRVADVFPELVPGAGRVATTPAPSPRPWPASGAGRCSWCSPTWWSRRCSSRCCPPCRSSCPGTGS